MQAFIDYMNNAAAASPLMAIVWVVMKIALILAPLLGAVAYTTFAERKIIGFIQIRIGPNRVGPAGWLQPIADAIKLVFKEVIIPHKANSILFMISPVLFIAPSLAAWAVVPFSDGWVLADINAGLLYILAMTSIGVYGVVIAGWASNSKYALLGALRSSAQIVSYEIAMGLALVGVLLMSNSLNIGDIVNAQKGGIWNWNFLALFPLFIIFWISGVAETNRAPFDMAEGESEIVAGFHVEYSGMTFAVFFLAEYANMILISMMIALMFMGGWLSPFEGIPFIGEPSFLWLIFKASFFLFSLLWFRATFPRFRYDQIMRLGWKVFIPITLGFIILEAIVLRWLHM